MRLLALLLFLASACAAQDVDHLIKLLSDDDFDIREQATEKLGHLHRNYAARLYKLSFVVEPETKMRLRTAVHQIVERQIVQKDDRWIRLHGWLGIEYSNVYSGMEGHDEASYMRWCRDRTVESYVIRWVSIDSPAADKLCNRDEITEVDGQSITELEKSTNNSWGWQKLGHIHTLKIKRIVQHEKFDDQHEPPPGEETEEVIIRVKGILQPDYIVNWSADRQLSSQIQEIFENDNKPKWLDHKSIEWARRLGRTTEP